MNDYIPDKPTVAAWLINGGAEIVLEVIRRKGWKVEVLPEDNWDFLPEIVVVADRVRNTMEINGAKGPYIQAMFAAAVVRDACVVPDKPYRDREEVWRRRYYPMLFEHDKFCEGSISLCTHFCDSIRLSSEATLSLIGKNEAIEKERITGVNS